MNNRIQFISEMIFRFISISKYLRDDEIHILLLTDLVRTRFIGTLVARFAADEWDLPDWWASMKRFNPWL
jgi:hypothetical protein